MNTERIHLGLAPMEGVTDFATRFFLSLFGSIDECTTPFFRITQGLRAHKIPPIFVPELFELKSVTPYDTIFQIMASNHFDCMKFIDGLEPANIPVIELNCGCPSPTVVGNGAGSSILKHPEEFAKRLDHFCKDFDSNRLSVKMRIGFDSPEEFQNLLPILKSFPLRSYRIHARTRLERYQGFSRWELIQHAAAATPISRIYGSGDINDADSLKKKISIAPNVKHILIGRGALRNPWIFSDIHQDLNQNSSTSTKNTFKELGAIVRSFAILQELQLNHPLRVIDFAGNFWSQRSDKTPFSWLEFYTSINRTLFDQSSDFNDSTQWHPFTIGRVKMFWNYFRSSLPEVFFDPKIFRTKSIPDFIHHLDKIIISALLEDQPIEPKYNQTLDWIYNGGRSSLPSL